MNLGNPNGCEIQDDRQRIQANYERLQAAIGCAGADRCWVHQVHGAGVVTVTAGQPFNNAIKADALVSDDPARVLSVRVADCVPVLLATANGQRVAAVHAGWRGLIAGVVPAAVREMRRVTGEIPLLAAIGPCIGYDAFEVGSEVLAEFDRVFGKNAPLRRTTADKGQTDKGQTGKGYVDLLAAIRLQLLTSGVADAAIDITDRCTHRDADEFFSHRREHGVTGRMAALIAPASSGMF
jgi:YfiH family protein